MTLSRRFCALALCAACLGLGSAQAAPPDEAGGGRGRKVAHGRPFLVVEVEAEASPADHLAVQACAGLSNRADPGSVFVHWQGRDQEWLDELGLQAARRVDSTAFLEICRREFPRCLAYSYREQQALLPNILTIGAVLEAIPVDEDSGLPCGDLAFDATVELGRGATPYSATRYVYDRYVDQTTGLAILNPGYDGADRKVWNPRLSDHMDASLVDFVYSEKLFSMFLINGCIPLTRQNRLVNEIAENNPWSTPISVYGYADYYMVFGGYVFEAHTRCSAMRNMGAIPTARTHNLSFFSSRREGGAVAVRQNPPERITYDRDKTYVAFVVGDGDNVAFVMDHRREWFLDRAETCRTNKESCPSLTWTLSPHLPHLAPDVLDWYYGMARETGRDYFMLPPSGYLYAYPSSLAEDSQGGFVAATERAARLLDTDCTVHWDWWTTWRQAERDFLPRYATRNGAIAGVFPVNVPYMFPTFTWRPNQFFKIIVGTDGGRVALFRPREWRGIDGSGNRVTKRFYLTPEDMAQELGSYPRGTVAYVYMTSDGGLTLANSVAPLAPLLPDHVRLVSAATAARFVRSQNPAAEPDGEGM